MIQPDWLPRVSTPRYATLPPCWPRPSSCLTYLSIPVIIAKTTVSLSHPSSTHPSPKQKRTHSRVRVMQHNSVTTRPHIHTHTQCGCACTYQPPNLSTLTQRKSQMGRFVAIIIDNWTAMPPTDARTRTRLQLTLFIPREERGKALKPLMDI